MRFLHLSDLHLGKSIHECSMLEDQRYILAQIEEIASEKAVEAVIIAGDVYDRSVPPAEAVELLDGFLTRLLARGVQILLISGNHDSPERLGFLGGIVEERGLHIESVFAGRARRVTLTDAHGAVHFYLLPYVKPAKAAPFSEKDRTVSRSEGAAGAGEGEGAAFWAEEGKMFPSVLLLLSCIRAQGSSSAHRRHRTDSRIQRFISTSLDGKAKGV